MVGSVSIYCTGTIPPHRPPEHDNEPSQSAERKLIIDLTDPPLYAPKEGEWGWPCSLGRGMERYGEVWRGMERYGEVWRGVERCAPKEGSELALLTGKRYGEVWRGMERCGELCT